MWARISELALAMWLAASPLFIEGAVPARVLALAAATWIALWSGLSLARILPRARALTLLAGLALAAAAFLHPDAPPPPLYQHHLALGLLVLLFGLVPNEAHRPPGAWRDLPGDTA